MYKEGHGQVVRPLNANFSYYDVMFGTWVRGMLHGKRIELISNLQVFPKGYYASLGKKVNQLKFIGEIRKGIWNGPASIYIDGKKLCTTSFQDQIEVINA
jgi:hypothetical protein